MVRETHSSRVRGDSSSGASDSIGACGARIVLLEHFVVLVVVVVVVVVVYVPAATISIEARKERESEGGGLKGHPKRRKQKVDAKEKKEGEPS